MSSGWLDKTVAILDPFACRVCRGPGNSRVLMSLMKVLRCNVVLSQVGSRLISFNDLLLDLLEDFDAFIHCLSGFL